MGSRDSIQEFFFSLSPRVVLLDRSFVKLALIQIVKDNAGNLLSYKDFQYLNYIKLLCAMCSSRLILLKKIKF